MKGRRFFGEKAYPAKGERNGRGEMKGGQQEEREAMIEKERGEHAGTLDVKIVRGAAENVPLPRQTISRRGHCEQRPRPS